MVDRFVIANLAQALKTRSVPGLIGWNRLEGRPRANDASRALRAEVSDALWFISRQRQMGEFVADDAGSPIHAAALVTETAFDQFESKGTLSTYTAELPAEARAEMLDPDFATGGPSGAMDLRLLMGRQWLRMIAPIGNFRTAFIKEYKFAPVNANDARFASICAHSRVWQAYAAYVGRAMDGYGLYAHLTGPGAPKAAHNIPSLSPQQESDLNMAGQRFVTWFRHLMAMPEKGEAWLSDRLEYEFGFEAPSLGGKTQYRADGYAGGALDWHSFDIAVGSKQPAPSIRVEQAIPTPISFAGMPDSRWWAFEDTQVNLGLVDVQTIETGKMLVLEFATLYANDWYILPLTLPVGVIADVEGIAVDTVFGERFFVTAAGEGDDADWRRWTMFTNSIKGDGHTPADLSMMLPATLPMPQQGDLLEDIVFVRDEIANIVWAIEKKVPLITGESLDGGQVALERNHLLSRFVTIDAAATPTPKADLRYRLMNSVPANWIPFVAARLPGTASEVRLQRGAMPFLIEGQTSKPWPIRPLSRALSHGLASDPKQPMFVREEEVTRAGIRITRHYQRVRWQFGRTVVWQSFQKTAGRGEGSSHLVFDQLRPMPH